MKVDFFIAVAFVLWFAVCFIIWRILVAGVDHEIELAIEDLDVPVSLPVQIATVEMRLMTKKERKARNRNHGRPVARQV